MASLAGAWTVLAAGFGGLRARGGRLSLAPRLPDGVSRLAFNYWYRHRNLCVSASPEEARYRLDDGDPVEILHYGQPVTVTRDETAVRIPPGPVRPRPHQPAGREPVRRRPPG
jgi:alpha,alpha-trehalose phosphorylase